MIIREATIEDLDLTFQWQTFPQIRKYCGNVSAPTYDEHTRWFSDTVENEDRDLLIAESEGVKVAQLRVDKDRDNEISILVAPEMMGKGVGQKVLSSLCERYRNISLTAKIHPDNKASVKIFLNCGFVKKSNDVYIKFPIE